jgi:hypothetical protein
MSNPTPATSPAATDWLTAAEDAYQQQQLQETGDRLRLATRHAELINARLAELGIIPLRQATVDCGQLQPAILVEPDFDENTYEVQALWSEAGQMVELHTADWETERYRFGRVRLLHSIADVAAARRETPTFPAPEPNYRLQAERSMSVSADYISPDAAAITTAIHGATAALLHLAQTVARTNTTV